MGLKILNVPTGRPAYLRTESWFLQIETMITYQNRSRNPSQEYVYVTIHESTTEFSLFYRHLEVSRGLLKTRDTIRRGSLRTTKFSVV